MNKLIKLGFGTAAIVLLTSATASAQMTQTASVTATANVAGKAILNVTGTVLFDDADPDTTPILSADPLNIQVKARTGKDEIVTLTVTSDGDLEEAGGATIGISNLTWLVSGTGFTTGIAAADPTQVTVGSWTGSGSHNGTQTYRLANSWAYATGSYSVTLTYTLTVP